AAVDAVHSVAGVPNDPVVAAVAADAVVTAPALQRVPARTAAQVVVADAAEQLVVARPADQDRGGQRALTLVDLEAVVAAAAAHHDAARVVDVRRAADDRHRALVDEDRAGEQARHADLVVLAAADHGQHAAAAREARADVRLRLRRDRDHARGDEQHAGASHVRSQDGAPAPSLDAPGLHGSLPSPSWIVRAAAARAPGDGADL